MCRRKFAFLLIWRAGSHRCGTNRRASKPSAMTVSHTSIGSSASLIISGLRQPAAANTGRARGSGDRRRSICKSICICRFSSENASSSSMFACLPDMRRMAINECVVSVALFLRKKIMSYATSSAHSEYKVTAASESPHPCSGITVPVLSQAPPCRPSALEAQAHASHALRHRRKLPSRSALQGRVTANAAAATPPAPRASRALLHAAPRRRASVADSSSSHASRKACIVAAGTAAALSAGARQRQRRQRVNVRQGARA